MSSSRWETTHEFSTSRIIRLFLYLFIAGIVVGAILVLIGVYTNLYLQLLRKIINLHQTYPALFGVYLFFVGVAVLDFKIHHRKKKPKKEDEKENEQHN